MPPVNRGTVRLLPRPGAMSGSAPSESSPKSCLLVSWGQEHRDRSTPSCDVEIDLANLQRDRWADRDAGVIISHSSMPVICNGRINKASHILGAGGLPPLRAACPRCGRLAPAAGGLPPLEAPTPGSFFPLQVVVREGLAAQKLRGTDGSGMNPLIQEALLLNETFTWLIRICANEVEMQWMKGREMPGVLINCRWGKHRSVAAAEQIAQELQRRWRAAARPVVVHLERPRWDHQYARRHGLTRDGLPWPLPEWLEPPASAFQPWTRAPVWEFRA